MIKFCVKKTDISTKEYCVTEMVFVLINLFTPSLTFDLNPNPVMHYWKSYVNHYTTGLIGSQGYNF